ncbi:hypothetical protein ABH926_004022 [Catenulispora sp. GP43]|uniref:hypothetical protein n=1 Tax=Catenulispora sp. GP43 TaxID=3156263 RepID=UPI0035154E35
MNRLNSIALLAGGALVAVAATGCASSAKPAAASPAAGSSTTAAAPSTTTSAAPGNASSSAPAGGSSSSPAGGSSSAPATGATSSTGSNSGSSGGSNGGSTGGSNAAAPVSHPACDNAKLNASLFQDQGQPPTNPIIAVKNTGPTCMINAIPYLWIVKSPTDASDELRPLIPGGAAGTAQPSTFLSGTTLYAAVDLDPGSASGNSAGYSYLEVTANPTKDSSGKDVQDLQLPNSMNVSGPKLGVYATNPSNALNALQYSTTPES